MIEIIKGSFFAGEVKTFLIQGEYVEILECAYPIDVAMMDRSGAQLSTMRNAEASYFSRPGKYEVIQVTSASEQTVRLFVGSGDAGTRRTSGVVEVVDGERSRTMAGGMFSAGISCSSVAAQYAFTQLWNPAASGKNLIVQQLTVGNSTSNAVGIFASMVELATNTTATQAANKKLGAPMGVATTKAGNSVIAQTAFMHFSAVLSGSQYTWAIQGAIIVPPGYGLTAMGNTLGAGLTKNIEWFEEKI